MLRTVAEQPTLWEAILPEELRRLPAELARVDSLLDVNGHRFLPVGGHENCPVAVMRSARWWPWDLPRGLVAATRSSGGG